MTEQWSDRSAMLNHKTLPPSGPLSYLHGSELKTWTSYWKREGSAGMDMWNAPTAQSRQPLTYRLMESVGLGGPRWLGSSWQRGIAESGSSQLSTLMIETPGDLVWDLPCVQQASCLEGGPLLWIWPLYLHVNQKSDDDDDDDDRGNPDRVETSTTNFQIIYVQQARKSENEPEIFLFHHTLYYSRTILHFLFKVLSVSFARKMMIRQRITHL